MFPFASAVKRLLCSIFAVLALSGFARIHDEAVIGGDGSAIARRFVDSTLVSERRYASGESPFSSAEIGKVTFELRHWFTRSPATRESTAADGAHDLTIRMPGRIQRLWGVQARDAGRSVTLDLRAAWPESREPVIVSDADFLHSWWFITLGVALFMGGMLFMLRRLEGR